MNSLEQLREELRPRLQDYLGRLGIKVNGPGKRMRCPFPARHAHGDANPSAVYYEQGGARVHCNGCGGHWDIFSLHKELNACVDFTQVLHELADMFGLTYPGEHKNTGVVRMQRGECQQHNESGIIKKFENPLVRDPETESKLKEWSAAFKGSAGEEYLMNRGISTETAQKYGIGFDSSFRWDNGEYGALVFPESKGYGLRNLAPAGSSEKKFRHFPSGIENGSSFNLKALWHDSVVFIVEGQCDALAIAEAGGEAIGLGGANRTREIIAAAKWKTPTARIVIALDTEENEKLKARVAAAGRELASGLREAGAFVYEFTDEVSVFAAHDANDALVSNKSYLIENIEASRKMAEDEFERWKSSDNGKSNSDSSTICRNFVHAFSSIGDPTPEEDNPDVVIPNGYLRRGQVLSLVSCAGVGKSVFTNQLAISWAAGKEFLHIPAPIRPLSVLVIQYEDDEEEMRTFIHDAKIGFSRIGWSDAEISDALNRVCFLDVWPYLREKKAPLVDENLLSVITEIQHERRFDVIIINPLSSAVNEYDISNNKEVNSFLRQKYMPVVNDPESSFLLVLVHHTGKVPKTEEARSDFMRGSYAQYDAKGASALMDINRASLMIAPTKTMGTFILVGAKRGEALGWKNADGKPTNEQYISHSKDIKFWVSSSPEEIAELNTDKKDNQSKPQHKLEDDVRVAAVQIRQKCIHSKRMLSAVECRSVAGAAFVEGSRTQRQNAAWAVISKAPGVYGLRYIKQGRFEYYGPDGVDAPREDGSLVEDLL